MAVGDASSGEQLTWWRSAVTHLHRLRWMVLFVVVAIVADAVLQQHVQLGEKEIVGASPDDWTRSPGMQVSASEGALLFEGHAQVTEAPSLQQNGDGAPTASLLVPVQADTEFVAVELCLTTEVPSLPATANAPAVQAAVPMLAFLRPVDDTSEHRAGRRLDFNRKYVFYPLIGIPPEPCYEDRFPRRSGDEAAVLQIQFLATGLSLGVQKVTITELRESLHWFWVRVLMLLAGLAAIADVFRRYFSRAVVRQHPLLSLVAVGCLGSILFGCCIPVHVKADIFAVLNGARVSPVLATDVDALRYAFPVATFAIFTAMHAILFAASSFFLGVLRLVKRASIVTVVVDMTGLAAATEALQFFVPGRGPGISDALIDCAGVAVAGVLLLLLRLAQRVGLFLKHQHVDEDVSRLR